MAAAVARCRVAGSRGAGEHSDQGDARTVATPTQARRARNDALPDLLRERILVLDGATGTLLQGHALDEAGFRGERFAEHPRDLKGANDLLSLTQPDIVREMHRQYLAAGADIITTNTFNATRVSMADYALEPWVAEMNRESARLAREAADEAEAADGAARYVLGSLGPTSRTASLSPDVNDPGARNTSFEELADAYLEAARALVEGGADILAIETIFDTLNAKAAIFAVETLWDEQGYRLPLIVSGTITDASGRTLNGQTVAAFWNTVRHARPLAVGLNCALGGKQLRPFAEELARIADTFLSLYPNAGLPNAFGGYDETPADTSEVLGGMARDGAVNIVGGCCGTGPDHVRAIKAAVAGVAPRVVPSVEPRTRLAGLEPFDIGPDSLFVNVGERTNVTGSRKFARLILEGAYAEAVEVARQQVENGAQVIDINMDEGMLDSEAAMTRFVRLLVAEPDIARVPFMIDSSKWSVIEAGLRSAQGRPIVNSLSLKEGETEFLRQARLARRYGAAVVVMAFDEDGQAETVERRLQHRATGVPAADRRGRLLRRRTSSSTPTSSPSAPASPSTTTTPSPSSSRCAASRPSCRACSPAAACPTSRSPSAATTPCARPSTPSSWSTPSPPAWTWPSSTPAPCRWSTTSTPSCASGSRTWCSTAAPMPPTGCSRSPTRLTAPPSAPSATSRGASCRWRSGSRTLSSRASATGSWRTPRRRGWRRSVRCTSSRDR